jgi:hypothetical protein
MKVPEPRQRTRELNHVPSATDVHSHRRLTRDGEIVQRGQVKNPRRLLFRQFKIGGGQAEMWLSDVALNEPKVFGRTIGELSDAIDLVPRTVRPRRLHQQDEATLFPRQTFQQAVGNKTREACDKECLAIRH